MYCLMQRRVCLAVDLCGFEVSYHPFDKCKLNFKGGSTSPYVHQVSCRHYVC